MGRLNKYPLEKVNTFPFQGFLKPEAIRSKFAEGLRKENLRMFTNVATRL
jgi:hypothetical protein